MIKTMFALLHISKQFSIAWSHVAVFSTFAFTCSTLVIVLLYRSMLLSKRNRDDEARAGFTKWPFMTTQSWAENPRGRWKLFVIFDSEQPQAGSLHEWSLLLHGTRKSPYVGQKVSWNWKQSRSAALQCLQEAQLPLRNRASATYFFIAKLISIAHSCL